MFNVAMDVTPSGDDHGPEYLQGSDVQQLDKLIHRRITSHIYCKYPTQFGSQTEPCVPRPIRLL